VLKWGYPFEAHWVDTVDGYKLEVFRLPHYGTSAHPATPVLLMHGLLVRALDQFTTACPSLVPPGCNCYHWARTRSQCCAMS
jgi:Partial alpha/beta-hydrolase lipase region